MSSNNSRWSNLSVVSNNGRVMDNISLLLGAHCLGDHLAVLDSLDISDSLADSLANLSLGADWHFAALLGWYTTTPRGGNCNWADSIITITSISLGIGIGLSLSFTLSITRGDDSTMTNSTTSKNTTTNSTISSSTTTSNNATRNNTSNSTISSNNTSGGTVSNSNFR